jgi:exodeoxyribonuclease VII large subunit
MKPESLSLSQLNQKIKAVISGAFDDTVWVVAEISELRVNSSGHCYMELIEKSAGNDQIIAKSRATIWSFTYRMLAPYFETTTGYRLDAGLKVLVKAFPEFHEVYGLSLVVKDIDPSYTLGDLARRKQEILKKLRDEGVIDMNRMLVFPAVPQRIAVISSETAAGFGDFSDTIISNSEGYDIRFELFAAIVQGEKATDSIIDALNRIYEREDEFDLVVIIRGGGAQSDLDCFNSYDLVYHITQFPIPVLSGIGHERDETITDIVAHTSVKTPTAAAELIISCFSEFNGMLDDLSDELAESAGTRISDERERLTNISQNLVFLVNEALTDEISNISISGRRLELLSRQFLARKGDILGNARLRLSSEIIRRVRSETDWLNGTFQRLNRGAGYFVRSKEAELAGYEKNLEYLKPEKVLMRGYSISSSGGKLVKDAADLKEGDELVTLFHRGKASSTVKKVQNK